MREYTYNIINDVYNWMISRKKDIEVRTLKEKSEAIQVGDIIIFNNQDNIGKFVKVKVINKTIVDNVDELLEKFEIERMMPEHTVSEFIELMNKIYGKELDTTKIVAFEFEYLSCDKDINNNEETIIYFMRHSEALKSNNINNSDSLQLQNEKWPLTINGENIAKENSKIDELKNFDQVYSSNYVRAISTAKYFTNDIINIDESFGERKFGVNDFDELPSDFGKKQFEDFDYKIQNGESINEVIKREEIALEKILKKHKGQKILVVGHSTALAALFSKWCEISYTGSYIFKGKEFFDGKWNHCEIFRLVFNNNTLISIENLTK